MKIRDTVTSQWKESPATRKEKAKTEATDKTIKDLTKRVKALETALKEKEAKQSGN